MTSSLPHSINTCLPKGFGELKNTKEKCNDLVYELVKNPRPIALTNDVYTPNSLTTASISLQIFPTIPTQRRVNYWYVNPLEVIGPSKAIRFNRMTINVNSDTTLIPIETIKFKAALYKLTSGGIVDDRNTHSANSEKIAESNVGTNTVEFDRATFINMEFPTTTISAYDDEGNENHYFLALIRSDTSTNAVYISSASNVLKPLFIPPPDFGEDYCLNYTYQSMTQNVATFTSNMENPEDNSVALGNFLYYSLWYFE